MPLLQRKDVKGNGADGGLCRSVVPRRADATAARVPMFRPMPV